MRDEEDLFETARALTDPGERRAFLETACAGKPELRELVEDLLAAAAEADAVFEKTPVSPGDSLSEPAWGSLANRGAKRGVCSDLKPGDRLGRYTLLQQIGEGGCGVVFMAEQEEPLRRRVALKVVKMGMDSQSVLARFEAEAQALARMEHPNIAKVFDVGATERGRPFFVMELVRGVKITAYCDQHRLSAAERLGLLIQVCQAVQHAHQKGIIHRDLKPSNILVTVNEGVPVPKVIDFGVAKAIEQKLTDKTLFTEFQALVGTPAYMSPEQADPGSVDIDTRSDIYSLGVLLYELLTGLTPFDTKDLLAGGFEAMRRTIREKEPVRPSTRLRTLQAAERSTVAACRHADPPKLIQLVHGDLDWIVMKCLEKDRTRRYATATGLAADVQRFLAHEPVLAHPPSGLDRLGKLIRRNKLMVALVSALTASLLIGLGLSTWLWVRESAAHASAIEAQRTAMRKWQRTDAQRIAAEHRLALERVNDGWALLDRDDYWGAAGAFTDALRLEQEDPQRAAVHRLRLAAIEPLRPRLLQAWSAGGPVSGAALSPDGQRLALALGEDSHGATARIFDRKTGKPLTPPMRHAARINAVEFSPDGRRLATASDDGTARVWDASNGQPVTGPLRQREPVQLARFSPDGDRLVTGDSAAPPPLTNGCVTVWDIQNERKIWRTVEAGLDVKVVSFTPDGRQIVIGCGTHHGVVADLDRGQERQIPNSWSMLSGAFSPDGRSLLVGGAFGDDARETGARLLDLTKGGWRAPRLTHPKGVTSVCFSPDGRLVATGSLDRTARVWDAATSVPLTPPLPHRDSVTDVNFSRDRRRLLTVSAEDTLRVWDVQTGQPLTPPLPHAGAVVLAQFSPDGERVWTVSTEGMVCTWAARSGMSPRLKVHHDPLVVSGGTGPPHPLAGSQAVVNARSTVSTLEPAMGRGLRAPNARALSWLNCDPFYPDGRRSAIGLARDPPAVVEFDCATGQITRRFEGDTPLDAAALTPDGGRLFGVGERGEVRVWDARSGQLLRSARLTPDINHPLQIRVSPDGRSFLVYGAEHTLATWNAATLDLVAPSLTRVHEVTQAFFSPDGRWIATINLDNSARIYNATSGLMQVPPLQHRGRISGLRFSPDGRLLATASYDNTARVWETATGQPVTPPLPHNTPVLDASFSADGKSLLTTGRNSSAWEWKLPAESRPLPELLATFGDPSGALFTALPWDSAAAFGRTLHALRAQRQE